MIGLYLIKKKIIENADVISSAFILIIFLLLFFNIPIINGFSQSSAKLLYNTDYIYKSYLENVTFFFGNGLLSDTVYQFFPWHKFTLESLGNNSLPFWNPYSLCGMPFLANYQSSIFEFTRVTSYFLKIPLNQFMLFSSFLELFLAGIFTYLYARNIKLTSAGSIICAISFMFSLPLVVWMEHPIGKVIIWLPLILLCIDKIISGRLRYIGFLAGAIGFQFFAGNPEISFFVLGVAFVYSVFRVASKKQDIKSLSRFKINCILSGAFILGFSIASVQILPFMDFLLQSDAINVGRTGMAKSNFWEAISAGNWNTWRNASDIKEFFKNIIIVVNPNLYGSPVMNSWWRISGNYNENSIYFGFLPLTLAILATLLFFKDKFVKFFASLGIASLFISVSAPIFVLFNYLPIFNLLNLGRLRLIFVFCGAVLAGIGFDYLLKEDGLSKRKLVLFNTLSLVLVLILFLTVFVSRSLMSIDLFREQLFNSYALILFSLFIVNILLFLYYNKKIFEVFGSRRKYMKYILVFIIFIDLFFYGYKYHSSIKEEFIYPNTKIVDFLKNNTEDLGRFTSFNSNTQELKSVLIPNSSIVFNLYDVRGFEVVRIKRYEELTKNEFNKVGEYVLGGNPSDKLLNLLGVKYIVQQNENETEFYPRERGYSLAYSDEYINIYENENFLPRAFLNDRIIRAVDMEDALNKYKSDEYNLSKETIIEVGDNGKEEIIEILESKQKKGISKVDIIKYSPNKVILEYASSENSFLILNDAYYKNWRAYVDNKETEIYPANVAFRGIVAPSGKHRVVFKYYPRNFNILIIISGIAVFMILLLCAVTARIISQKTNE